MGVLEKVSEIFNISPKGFAEICLTLGGFIFLFGVIISIPGMVFGIPGSSELGGLCIAVGIFLMIVGILIYVAEKTGVLEGE